MLISELSKKTGLSKDTIRFYEKIGLIGAGSKHLGKSHFKQYGEETIERLVLIRQAKKLGFTLNEIKQALDDWQNNKISQTEKIEIIQSRIEKVNERISQLHELKTYLTNKLEKLKQEPL